MATYNPRTPVAVLNYFGLPTLPDGSNSIRYDTSTILKLRSIDRARNRLIREGSFGNVHPDGRTNYTSPGDNLHWAWNNTTSTWIVVGASTGSWIASLISDDIPPTPTPSISPTNTPTISISPTNTPTISITPTNTPTISITATNTPTITPTVSITSTNTSTPTISVTNTITPSPTPTLYVSSTPTPTNTTTPTITTTTTLTPTISITPTISKTPTNTPTITRTPTITPTVTPTLSTNCFSPSVSPSSLNFIGQKIYQVIFKTIRGNCDTYCANKITIEITLHNLDKDINTHYNFVVPDDSQSCCDGCEENTNFKLIQEFYTTFIFDDLITGDRYSLTAKASTILPTPTPTQSITPTISVTPTITSTVTPTISVTPTITPTISVTSTVTPTITITPTQFLLSVGSIIGGGNCPIGQTSCIKTFSINASSSPPALLTYSWEKLNRLFFSGTPAENDPEWSLFGTSSSVSTFLGGTWVRVTVGISNTNITTIVGPIYVGTITT